MSDKPENFKEWYAKEWAEYCGTITPKSMMKIAFKAGADLAKPSECGCCRKPSDEYYSVCPDCFKNDHQPEKPHDLPNL